MPMIYEDNLFSEHKSEFTGVAVGLANSIVLSLGFWAVVASSIILIAD